MYSIILADKSFEIKNLERTLERLGKTRSDFMQNYGILARGLSLQKASELSDLLRKDFSIKTVCIKELNISLPLVEEVSGLSLIGNMFFDGKEKIPIDSLKAIALFQLKVWGKNNSPFYYRNNFLDSVRKIEKSIFAQFYFKNKRIMINSENFDYSTIIKYLENSCQSNLKKLIKTIIEIKPSLTNKTLDLFLLNKDIEYFTYEDSVFFDRELIWLKTVSEKG